jgi:hypothetical protein
MADFVSRLVRRSPALAVSPRVVGISVIAAVRPQIDASSQSDHGGWFLLIPVALLILLWLVILLFARLVGVIELRLRHGAFEARAPSDPHRPSLPGCASGQPAAAELSEVTVSTPTGQAMHFGAVLRSWAERTRELRILWHRLRPRSALDELGLTQLGIWGALGELCVVGLIVVLFCAPFLDFNPDRLLPGREFDVVALLDHVMVNSLQRFGGIPTWNFQLRTGQPLIGDPFMHMFNPISTIPVLLLGVDNGFKVAALASLMVAAYGQWFLSRVTGLNRPTRIWAAIMFALNGQAVARFIQGEYLFTFGFAWIPLICSGTLLSLRTRRTRYYALTAVSFALMFFSGNGYYTFYAATLLGLLTLSLGLSLTGRWNPSWSVARVRPLLIIGALAIGLTAVQWFPTLELWGYIQKGGDPFLVTSQSLIEALKNYTVPSIDRILNSLPPEEYYGYIGLFPLLAAPLSLIALWHGWKRREILALIAMVTIAFAWICVRYTPFAAIYSTTPLFVFLRYPSRIMVFGTVAILTLGGLGMTWLTQTHEGTPVGGTELGRKARGGTGWILGGIFVLAMFLSVLDVYRANRRIIGTTERNHEADAVLSWLGAHDPTPSYISIPEYEAGWELAAASFGQRYLDAWYGYDFFPPGENPSNRRPVEARPNYVVLDEESPPPAGNVATAGRVDHHVIYAVEDSLPFSFAVSDSVLSRVELGMLQRSEVIPLLATQGGPAEVSLRADLADKSSWVVLMTSYFPGWRVYVDGRPGEIVPLGNYLSVEGRPGEHEYTFRYESTSFKVGFVITCTTMLFLVGWLLKSAYSLSGIRGVVRISRRHA